MDEAESAEAALVRLEQAAFDLVLLDIGLPAVDGLTLAEHPRVPLVVFKTADLQHAAVAFELDAVDYLTKPVRQDRLDEAWVRRRLASGGDHRSMSAREGAVPTYPR